MPPKKSGGDGSKKKAKAEPEAELSPAELLQKATLRIESLEQQLVWKEERMMEAVRSQKELRDRVFQYHNDFSKEKEDVLDVTSHMITQYTAMKEELMRKINALESTITSQRDELEMARIEHEETKKEKDQIIALKDAEIAEQKQKMEEMALEFGGMLRETLDRLGERIESTSTTWEVETGAPIVNRLQEFKLST